MQYEHEEFSWWCFPGMLQVSYRRFGASGDGEMLEICFRSPNGVWNGDGDDDWDDTAKITIRGSIEISQFATIMRELADRLN